MHLGVEVPEPDAARIRVGEDWRHWSQSKTVAFDDSFEHEVVHDGEQERIVLSVDLWHPALSEVEIRVLGDRALKSFGYA